MPLTHLTTEETEDGLHALYNASKEFDAKSEELRKIDVFLDKYGEINNLLGKEGMKSYDRLVQDLPQGANTQLHAAATDIYDPQPPKTPDNPTGKGVDLFAMTTRSTNTNVVGLL